METIDLGLILSTLAELASVNLLWSIFGLMVIVALIMTLIFFYHWHKFIIGRRMMLMVSTIYSLGTLIFLAGLALLINFFFSL